MTFNRFPLAIALALLDAPRTSIDKENGDF
jgi:hypothetical protein